jgi:hypothetical protein
VVDGHAGDDTRRARPLWRVSSEWHEPAFAGELIARLAGERDRELTT